MSSNLKIEKICQWCGKSFIARTTTTAYCSHRCSGLAYKKGSGKRKLKNAAPKFSVSSRGKHKFKRWIFLRREKPPNL